MTGPDRVAVLADEYLFAWQVDALGRMLEETPIDISVVVVNEACVDGSDADPRNNPRSIGLSDLKLFIDVWREHGAWALVLAERKLGWVICGMRQTGMQRRHVEDIEPLAGVPRVRCSPEGDGAWNSLPEDVVAHIAEEADMAVRFGFGLLEGAILTAPEYGVLSFHPADIRRYRGAGPSQAFRDGVETTGATLQQLGETIDGGRIVAIETIDITNAYTLDEVRARVNALQREMLATGIENLRSSDYYPYEPETLGEYNSLDARRSLSYSIPIVAKNIMGRIRERLE
jgi:folate-dependent phosphoribosylglycinamide formyltransferase PurN